MRGWILKHDILAAGRCRVPTDLNLETHIKLWRMCSDLNSAREEFSETENFWSPRPWLGWQICKLNRICRFWRIDQYFEGLEGLIRIALHQIGCKVHIGWEVLDGLPKSLLVRKWIYTFIAFELLQFPWICANLTSRLSRRKKLMISHFRNSYQVSTFCLP